MQTQTSKKLFAFIIIIMMFSVNLVDAQRTRKGFIRLKDFKTDRNTAYLQNNKPFENKQDCPILSQKTIGGNGDEDRGAIRRTIDGYITCGSTTSTDGNFKVPANHDYDAYVVKLNNAGQVVWTHTYGGSSYDDFNDIIPTSDGGFITTGGSISNDGDLTGNHGDEDVWVVKLDAKGQIQWQKNYGGTLEDHGNFIVETSTGYAFCAGAESKNGDLTLNRGDLDAWIVKISYTGDILFQKTYGGNGFEEADGLYFNKKDKTIIFGCDSQSNNHDVSGNHGQSDAWIIKIDETGNIIWKKTLGGSGDDVLTSITRTTDGNIVFAGFSNSFDGDVAGNNGLYVAWVVKLNATNGNTVWNKSFGEPAQLGARGVIATADGGVVVMGLFGITTDFEAWDAMVMKLKNSGEQQWIKIFGGSKADYAEFGAEMPNGNIITSNYTESNDGEIKNAKGGSDIWIVTLGNCSNDISATLVQNLLANNETMGGLSFSNYTNQVTKTTIISLNLDRRSNVTINIFDMNGTLIKTMANVTFDMGPNQIDWNADKAGIYVMQIQSGEYSKTIKFVVSN